MIYASRTSRCRPRIQSLLQCLLQAARSRFFASAYIASTIGKRRCIGTLTVAPFTTRDEASQTSVENGDCCLSHLHSTPSLKDPCRNIVIMFGVEKLEWCGYPMLKKLKICSLLYSFRQNTQSGRQTDERTETARRHRPDR